MSILHLDREVYQEVCNQHQFIKVLQAAPDCISTSILEYLSTSEVMKGYERFFSRWEDSSNGDRICSGYIRVYKPKACHVDLPLTLIISAKRRPCEKTLLLKKTEEFKYKGTYSINECGLNTIPIGLSIQSASQARIKHIGSSVLTLWIIRGKPWVNAQREIATQKAARRKTGLLKSRAHIYV